MIDYIDMQSRRNPTNGWSDGHYPNISHSARGATGRQHGDTWNSRFRSEKIERVLRERRADIISMVNAHIADPGIVAKTLASNRGFCRR